jgi:hypothetical protein
MIIHRGDIVRLNDNTLIKVTDAVDQDAPEVIENPDDLFMGYRLNFSTVINAYFPDTSKLIVNPMSEVVAVENELLI